jgi:hypothetical protein
MIDTHCARLKTRQPHNATPVIRRQNLRLSLVPYSSARPSKPQIAVTLKASRIESRLWDSCR